MKTLNLIEVAGTSKVAKKHQFNALLADKTPPVFELQYDSPRQFNQQLKFVNALTEVVAVSFRDESRKVVHGGLFGYAGEEVFHVVLRDLEGKVDTSKNPENATMGLLLMSGPIVVRQSTGDRKMEASIIDIDVIYPLDGPINYASPGRVAVLKAYLEDVLPTTKFARPV